MTIVGGIDQVRLVVDNRLVAKHPRHWGKEHTEYDPVHYLALSASAASDLAFPGRMPLAYQGGTHRASAVPLYLPAPPLHAAEELPQENIRLRQRLLPSPEAETVSYPTQRTVSL